MRTNLVLHQPAGKMFPGAVLFSLQTSNKDKIVARSFHVDSTLRLCGDRLELGSARSVCITAIGRLALIVVAHVG